MERRGTLSVDPDIRRAATIPSAVYTDAAFLERVREQVFARSWLFAADLDSVRARGQVHPFLYSPGLLDEPLVLSRDQAGTLHCLSNVCTHRGNIVIAEPATVTSMRCTYHGRRFALDGKFQSMPEFEGVEGHPRACDHLAAVPVATWARFAFASLEPAFPLEELVGDMAARLRGLPVEKLSLDAGRSRDYTVHANWALYCDNYLEGFHIPFVHHGLNQELDYGSYRTELFRRSILQVGIAKGSESSFDLPRGAPDHGQAVAAYYWFLFPNMMFNFYPWGLSLNIVRPLGIDLTKIVYLVYVWDGSKLDRGAGADLDKVELEDEAIIESVQRGVRSRYYDRGRYSPSREQGVHHFHRLLEEMLEGEATKRRSDGATKG